MTILWVYLIGLVAFGPFPDLSACMQARSQHLAAWYPGQVVTAHVGMCKPLEPEFTVAPPTYGAPLTPGEYGRREVGR